MLRLFTVLTRWQAWLTSSSSADPVKLRTKALSSIFLYGNTTDTDAHVRQAYIRGGVADWTKSRLRRRRILFDRADLFSRDREIAAMADRTVRSAETTGQPDLLWTGYGADTTTALPGPAHDGASAGLATETFVLNNLGEEQVTRESYRIFDPPAGCRVAAPILTRSTSAPSRPPFRRWRNTTIT